MGYTMINEETDSDFFSQRQQFVFKGAVLLVCAAILAMVFLSGRHETRATDQCSQGGTRESCLSEPDRASAHPPVKDALAPLGRASTAREGTN
jgi:hypothetical protein